MKTLTVRMFFLLTIVVVGCQKDEFTSLNENTEQVKELEEPEQVEESESEVETEEPEGTGELEAPGEVIDSEDTKFGSVSYKGRIPTESSKVPSCKQGTPDSVIFVMTDSIGVTHTETVPAAESGGLVTTLTPALMPLGKSTVDEVLLMKGQDTLYAIPSENDLELVRYTETTVPFEVQVSENTELTGDAFCYTKEEIELPEDVLINGGFGTQRLQTLWIDVQGDCIDIITVTIDAYRVLEIYPFQNGLYDVPIPENYDRMDVRAYTSEYQGGVNDFEAFTFGGVDVNGNALPKYDPDSNLDVNDIVRFSFDCPEEEFPDEDF